MMQKNPGSLTSSRKFLFLCGCPRSGTGALSNLFLNLDVCALGVERFNHLYERRTLGPGHFERQRFFDVRPGDTWLGSFDILKKEYAVAETRYDSAIYHGDKFPRAYEFYDHLIARFDDVRFVFIVRNIRDVAVSYEARRAAGGDHWPKDRDFRVAVADWNRSIRETLIWRDYAPILVVSYEDLVLAQMGGDRIALFLGIPRSAVEEAVLTLPVDHRPRAALPPGTLPDEIEAHIRMHADFAAYETILAASREFPPCIDAHAVVDNRTNPKPFDHYGADDERIVDYRQWHPAGSRSLLRGPEPSADRMHDYVLCIGSAATFGRLVQDPFPAQLERALGMPVVNAGLGGARPVTFLTDGALCDLIRRARLVVLEVLSARGYATPLFTPDNHDINMGQPKLGLDQLLRMPARPLGYFVDHVYERALRVFSRDLLEQVRRIILQTYIEDMKRLMAMAGGPVLLVYVSQRSPDYIPSLQNFDTWSGGFPHLVDRRTWSVLADRADDSVEIVSRAGLPAPVFDRLTGEPVAAFPHQADPNYNRYYPSQEMHDEVAAALLQRLPRLLPDVGAG
jgi:hypothetical protein